MSDQPTLWVPAVEALTFNAGANAYGYWSVRVAWRRSGEAWKQAQTLALELLTTGELVDALDAHLATVLEVS